MDEGKLYEVYINDEWEQAELIRKSESGKTLYFQDPFDPDVSVSHMADAEGATWREADLDWYKEPASRPYHPRQCPTCKSYDPAGYSGAKSNRTLQQDIMDCQEGTSHVFGNCWAAVDTQILEQVDDGNCGDYEAVPPKRRPPVNPSLNTGWDNYSR